MQYKAMTAIRRFLSKSGHHDLGMFEEHPLRTELLSLEQLYAHARKLAGWHDVDPAGGPDQLLDRLAENDAIIATTYQRVAEAVHQHRHIVPAEDWLLDNYHVIDAQVRMARKHLPRSYSRQLPRLLNGRMAGYPRVYDLALELISHSDGVIDRENLTRFVHGYQQVTALSLGELWAVPIMLRIALIENIRRVCARLAWARRHQELADYWADRILETASRNPGHVVIAVAEMAKQDPELNTAFVPHLHRQLQVQTAGVSQGMAWVEQQLAERGQTVDQIVQYASDVEAADQIAFANSITSLRALSGMSWRRFVESMSVVDKALSADPAGVYPQMDFDSRDRCRHVIERLSRRTGKQEAQVVEHALKLARNAVHDADPQHHPAAHEQRMHVGYYLLDQGLPQLQAAIGAGLTFRQRMARTWPSAPLLAYLGAAAFFALAVGLSMVAWTIASTTATAVAILLGLLAAWGASSIGLSLVNLVVTRVVSPRMLPKLDFSKGIPDEHRALVAVPTLMTSADTIRQLVDDLEIRFLANRDDNLLFALLTDFTDADCEHKDGEEKLLTLMRKSIERLNQRYAVRRSPVFYWLHRPRQWNEQEGVWMAWERKRGKLMQVNRLILNGEVEAFSQIVGEVSALQKVRYIIPLDADTQLPHDAARQMVATLAHPLNRPHVDPTTRRVTRGYAILQPLVSNGLDGANSSRYGAMMSGEAGVDPYTRQASDVYQDLFAEGTYIGKGIHDIAAFEQTLAERFPENQLLSHDLIESCYARSALISDVQLIEDYPSTYLADMNRRHRWVRGDWQIAFWLLPQAPNARGQWVSNPIRALGRWKIFDNLRRSLTPAALIAAVVGGWMLTPQLAWAWTLLLLALYTLPVACSTILALASPPHEAPLAMHLGHVFGQAGRSLSNQFAELMLLPYEAYTCLDAIVRSVWQMAWRKRGMLTWRTSGEATRTSRQNLPGHLRAMWISPLLALAAGAGMFAITGTTVPALAAAPILTLWLIGPLLAWWLSQPRRVREAQLSHTQRRFLCRITRLTWRYFETFITDDTNYLPPDNYQETGDFGLDARTSPTNIGIGLLASLTATDLGYISIEQLIDRTQRTFDAMGKLERYHGHFYNWYDTRTLTALPPHYVSTVDSGNLAGHLLVTEAGLRELAEAPSVPVRLFEGIADTVDVGRSIATDQGSGTPAEIRQKLDALAHRITHMTPGTSLTQTYLHLQSLGSEASELHATAKATSAPESDLLWWTRAMEEHVAAMSADLKQLSPYVMMLNDPDRDLLPATLQRLLESFDRIPTLTQAACAAQTWRNLIKPLSPTDPPEQAVADAVQTWPVEATDWLQRFEAQLKTGSDHATARIHTLESLAQRAEDFADMDFAILYDEHRHLLRIGLNARDHAPDPSYYDLLASEARLASYLAIAAGQLPHDHWFSLSRTLTITEGHTALVSWSGSMFEYLMPNLVMPSSERTLLDTTNTAAVRRHIQYGRQRGVPWGASESSYAALDVGGHYQYQAFGVPGLGLKRGLHDDLVVAPYASAMAAMIVPVEAAENLIRLSEQGALGRYGFYEAVDYTRSRLPHGETSVPTRLYMAHHGGMTFVGIAQELLDRPMHRRFLANPRLRSVRTLLHERVPSDIQPVYPHAVEAGYRDLAAEQVPPDIRIFTTPHTDWPRVHMLSNGRYHVMVSNSGGGYSRWQHYAVTRWQEDRTTDGEGQFVYLRDRRTGEYWSVSHHPTRVESDRYEAIFTQGRAEFKRLDHEIFAHMIISVSPEDDVEIRRLTLTNHSSEPREIEVTSYGEIVLSDPAADHAHPAFGKLFVQTELLHNRHSLIATRRPRQAGESPPWMFHQMHVQGHTLESTTFETDRDAFLGRARTAQHPAAMQHDRLGDTAGSVLDPVFAIRRIVTLQPDESAIVDVITGMAHSRQSALEQVSKHCDHHFADRVFDLAPARSQLMLQHLGASEPEAQLYGRLASAVLHGNPAFRARPSVLLANRLGQSALWRYGISGDLSIVLLTIAGIQHVELAAQALKAHAYWASKGLAVDLVIINDDFSGYRQELQDSLNALIGSGPSAQLVDKPGGIFLRRGDQISTEDRTLLQTVARLVLDDSAGDLAKHADRRARRRPAPAVAPFEPTRAPWDQPATAAERRDLLFYNGYGGFTRDGHEYITSLARDQTTPAPWSNVMANDRFGTIVTESGSSYTWFENAHEFRLTPWYNDPVTDRCGEAIYLRDEHTGQYWSPTPLPCPGNAPYATRHGFGYTIFEHEEGGIRSEMSTFVATDAPAKFYVVKLKNHSDRPRRISVTAMVEWVLSEHRSKGAMHVVTELDPKTGAMFARNWYNTDFPGRVAFMHVSEPTRTVTGDRGDFVGRNRTLANPAAMELAQLSGRLGAGLDPCGAIMTAVDLAEGAEREVVFLIGAGSSEGEAHEVLQRYGWRNGHRKAIEDVWSMWNHILGTVHVQTPDPGIDMLVNGWLIYQTLACRIWGRSGYYQSGGAFGFRDQLQDSMALLHAAPWIYRGHIIYSCEHQFVEGDVQHWWHPPTNRGVRTRIRDDYLWLPYAAARYVSATGDTGVLQEQRPYLAARLLAHGEESCYDLPAVSDEVGTVYEHCVRAIEYGLTFGSHGLPIIGSGDWNDGMDRVGPEGQGESVWLAFFLYDVLTHFAPIAQAHGDQPFADRCRDEAKRLQENIEQHGWDGQWYRRAYFDDGTPLGSHVNPECQIDAIPQAWAAITGAADSHRIAQAMQSVDRRLVRRDIDIIQLFDPPFDKSDLEPGYIKGYVPGVRENGGQYTHAATWVTMGFAMLGDAERAWECLNIINPVRHGGNPESIATYKVEPYVMAADVYGVKPHEGRGGWTWYTGSGAWTYRLIIETILGLRLHVDTLYFEPCLPSDWGGYHLHYRYRETFYHINVIAPAGHGNHVASVTCDGQPCPDLCIHLIDDRVDHKTDITLA